METNKLYIRQSGRCAVCQFSNIFASTIVKVLPGSRVIFYIRHNFFYVPCRKNYMGRGFSYIECFFAMFGKKFSILNLCIFRGVLHTFDTRHEPPKRKSGCNHFMVITA